RIAGESVDVWADIFREGHDVLAAALLWRHENEPDWHRSAMAMHSNDRWHCSFTPPTPGAYLFAIEAWTDQFATWRKEFVIRRDVGRDLSLPAHEGLGLLSQLRPKDRKARTTVDNFARRFVAEGNFDLLLDDALAAAMAKTETRPDLTRSQAIPLLAERERARAGAWYEMVPRSQGTTPGRHGTFDDCMARVP